ncbi:MAG: hypothetical protein AB2693_33265 [Candidatus Thiodiazotropha sp.]
MADGQTIAQNYTTMRVMVTIQFWNAVNTQKTIYSQPLQKEIGAIAVAVLKKEKSFIDNIPAGLFKEAEGS